MSNRLGDFSNTSNGSGAPTAFSNRRGVSGNNRSRQLGSRNLDQRALRAHAIAQEAFNQAGSYFHQHPVNNRGSAPSYSYQYGAAPFYAGMIGPQGTLDTYESMSDGTYEFVDGQDQAGGAAARAQNSASAPRQRPTLSTAASTCEEAHYLRNTLFSKKALFSNNPNATTSFWVLPDSFFVLIAPSRYGISFFSGREWSVDESETFRLKEESWSLELPKAVIERINRLGRRVRFNGADQTWRLNGVPSFICIEGSWNARPHTRGQEIDLPGLILRGGTQDHGDFTVRVLPAVWETMPQTPELRGFRFDHAQAQFKLWVHEKNAGALAMAKRSLKDEIEHLHRLNLFFSSFEEAFWAFSSNGHILPKTERGSIDIKGLQSWASLIKPDLFPDLASDYQELSKQVKTYVKNKPQRKDLEKALLNGFKKFFHHFPRDAHFSPMSIFAKSFKEASEAFNQNRELVRNSRGHVDEKELRNWQKVITKAYLYLQTPYRDLPAVTKSAKDYFQLKKEMKKLGRKKDDASKAKMKELREKQAQLELSLNEGFGHFFRSQESALAGSRALITTGVTQAIAIRKRKLEQYQFFNLCASGLGDFRIQEYLQDRREEGRVRVEIWLNLVSEHSAGNHSRPLCQAYESYLNGRGDLQAVVDLFAQFFNRHVARLSATDKQAFIEKLKEGINPPRSFTDTTVQINYRKPLSAQELKIIVRLERLNQVRKLASERPFLEGLFLTDELLQGFKDLCQKVSTYMVKKAKTIKTIDHKWVEGFSEQVPVERYGDPYNNYNQPYRGTNSVQEVYHHLSNIMQYFGNLHTKIQQGNNEADFLRGPLLAEECSLLSEMYAFLSHMAFELKVPFSWDTHKAIHKHSKQIRTAEKALREGANGYSLHKRISHSGEALWTIVKNGERSSDIDQENQVHAGVYCR